MSDPVNSRDNLGIMSELLFIKEKNDITLYKRPGKLRASSRGDTEGSSVIHLNWA